MRGAFPTDSGHLKPQFDTVIVRFGGEIGIKAAWTRKFYERRLISNIRAMLKQKTLPYEILNRKFGRLYVKTSCAEETCQALSHVFGVSSASSAVETTSKLEEIIENSVLVAGSMFKEEQTFAVRCRRVGTHAYASQDVCRCVGQAILDAYASHGLSVDLKHPDLTLEVEVREDRAYVFTESFKGPGGLPLGVQPKIIGLLSGNVNSIVACWMAMKRGCPIIPLHFVETPYQRAEERKALWAARALFKWAPGFSKNVQTISHKASITKLGVVSSKALKSILLKRLTFRVSERLAEMCGAEGIVTGDAIQKPARENLHLFRLCDEASLHLPIHRPLIGLEDSEIEEIARRIGINRKLSVKAKGRGKLLNSAGKISLGTVKAAEVKVNMDELVELSLESLRTISL